MVPIINVISVFGQINAALVSIREKKSCQPQTFEEYSILIQMRCFRNS